MITLVLLPGMDATGSLFSEFLDALGPDTVRGNQDSCYYHRCHPAKGLDIKAILGLVIKDSGKASVLIAHNIQFDEKILGSELLRASYENYLEAKPRRCTMQLAKNYCHISGPYGYKWPTLQTAHTLNGIVAAGSWFERIPQTHPGNSNSLTFNAIAGIHYFAWVRVSVGGP